MKEVSDNRRIAKNTLILYVRMLFMLILGLFTSRITLHALGSSDYGIANLVGGLVGIFTFLNGTLAGSTQRYITYALGTGDNNKLQDTFSSAFVLHALLSIVLVFIIEIIGLWVLRNKLIIPEGRMNAAFWMFQFSTISCGLSVLQVPYNACVIAHEKMGAFAFLSVFDVLAKLLILLIVWYYPGDRLLLYGLLWFIVGIFTFLLYRTYSILKFKEAHYRKIGDKNIIKEILSFSGWDTIGTLALTLGSHGVNVLFNMFYGTIVNAANALSQTVNGAIMQFVGNFQTASRPQIVKLYAANKLTEMYKLVENTAKFSAFIFLFLAIPVWIKVDFILNIWLGYDIPLYLSDFIRITIIQNLIYTIGRPMVACMVATGQNKLPNMVNGPILLLIFPATYFILKLGYPPPVAYAFNILPWTFQVCFETWYVYNLTGVGGWNFMKNVCFKVFVITIICFFPGYLINEMLTDEWASFVLVILISSFSLLVIVYYWGISESNRQLIKANIKSMRIFNRE